MRFVDEDDEKEVLAESHYSKSHWERATTETLVKIGDLEEPYIALIDHGLGGVAICKPYISRAFKAYLKNPLSSQGFQ